MLGAAPNWAAVCWEASLGGYFAAVLTMSSSYITGLGCKEN